MKEFTRWLSALLGLQLCIVAALYIADRDEADFDQQQNFVSVEKAAIQALTIEDGEASVRLERDGEQWRLPDYGNLPVNQTKFDDTLNKLLDAERGWPVAATSASQRRFEVAEDDYQRKIVLRLEDSELTVYLGTSPSYRNVHARVEGDDDVFSVKLATFDFPTEYAEWFDTALLSVDQPNSIKGPDFELARGDEGWAFVEAAVVDAQAPDIDTEKARKLSTAFENMRVQSMAVNVDPAEETLALIVSQGDTALTYHFFVQNDEHYVKRQDLDAIFVISKNDYDKVAQVNRAYLAATPGDVEESRESLDLSAADGN